MAKIDRMQNSICRIFPVQCGLLDTKWPCKAAFSRQMNVLARIWIPKNGEAAVTFSRLILQQSLLRLLQQLYFGS